MLVEKKSNNLKRGENNLLVNREEKYRMKYFNNIIFVGNDYVLFIIEKFEKIQYNWVDYYIIKIIWINYFIKNIFFIN